MTPPDDELLEAQLRRRASNGAVGAALGNAIRSRVAAEGQVAVRPWHRLLPALPGRGSRPAWAVTGLAALLVLTLGAATLVGPGNRPAPSGRTAWFLTAAELEAVVRAAPTHPENIGRTIVAAVQLDTGSISCPAPGPCQQPYSIRGTNPPIPVGGLVGAPACPPSFRCAAPRSVSGPVALTIRSASVEFVGYVGRVGQSPSAIPEYRRALLDPVRDDAYLTVVDGWLVDDGGLLSCPAVILPGSSAGAPGAVAPGVGYGCGDANWITAYPYQPTTIHRSSDAISIDTRPPADGIRVQNGAYGRYAPDPARTAPGDLPEARRGLYLLGTAGLEGTDCFSCTGAGRAWVFARIEPVDLPAGPAASPSATPPAIPTTEPPTFSAQWYLDLPGLVGAVATARNGGGVGRIVVANVSYGVEGGDPSCRGEGLPNCLVVVEGSSPPIHVRDTRNAIDCPPTWYCTLIREPGVPQAGPAALRLRPDGDVEFIGYVQTPVAGGPAFGFGDLAALLGRLTTDELDAYRLYVVHGWLSGALFIPRCLAVASADDRFDCGQSAWLTAGPYQPNELPRDGWSLTPPTGGIQVQNGAFQVFGNPPAFDPVLRVPPDGVEGTWLVRPVVPVPAGCWSCSGNAVADLVARLDAP